MLHSVHEQPGYLVWVWDFVQPKSPQHTIEFVHH